MNSELKKISSLSAMIIMMLLIFLVCSMGTKAEAATAKKTVAVGEHYRIKTSVNASYYTWKSSKSSVASVSSKGVVIGRKTGKATITGRRGSSIITYKVTVSGKYKTIYKKLLYSGTFKFTEGGSTYYPSIASFAVLDIDRNGVPELILKAGTNSSYNGYKQPYHIFTVKNGKLYYSGSFTMSELRYNYSKKLLVGIESYYYWGTIQKNYITAKMSYYKLKTVNSGNAVSYVSSAKSVTMYSNNVTNINKVLR